MTNFNPWNKINSLIPFQREKKKKSNNIQNGENCKIRETEEDAPIQVLCINSNLIAITITMKSLDKYKNQVNDVVIEWYRAKWAIIVVLPMKNKLNESKNIMPSCGARLILTPPPPLSQRTFRVDSLVIWNH